MRELTVRGEYPALGVPHNGARGQTKKFRERAKIFDILTPKRNGKFCKIDVKCEK